MTNQRKVQQSNEKSTNNQAKPITIHKTNKESKKTFTDHTNGKENVLIQNLMRLFVYFEFNHPCEYRDIFSVITEQQLFPRRSVSMHTKIHLRFTHF